MVEAAARWSSSSTSFLAGPLTTPGCAGGDDGAVLPAPGPGERLVLATDAHVVSPLFFPGGDIGSLAVHGTVNDLAVMGARPALPGSQLHP
jgi:hydrogenase expression/formation protein HypE